MYSVIIPIGLLFTLIMVKKIPKIGGNVPVALIIAAVVTLICGKVYNPIEWGKAWINGLDRLSWVMALSFVGSFYGETQAVIGTLDTVVDLFRSLFGKSSRGMVCAVIVAIVVGGEAFGDCNGAAAVIGLLVVPALAGMGMSGEKVAATIALGCMLGSIMPPISQAVMLSTSILDLPQSVVDETINLTFITAGIILVLSMTYAAFGFVKNQPLPKELIPEDKPLTIVKKGFAGLLPLILVIVLIIANSIFNLNIMKMLLGPVYDFLAGIPIIKGFTNSIVMILIAASLITFIFKKVRNNAKEILQSGFKNVIPSLEIQACAAFFVGAILAGGQIDVIINTMENLSDNVVKIGGGIATVLMGMLTGSQTSAQNIIFTFFGPLLMNMGVSGSHAAMVGSHLASAGQMMPLANFTVMICAALVSSSLGKKVDPLKAMMYLLPIALSLAVVGFLFMYI